MIVSGTRMKQQKQTSTVLVFAIGDSKPILFAKSKDVSLRSKRPPTKIPKT